jgi:hypothetical protein
MVDNQKPLSHSMVDNQSYALDWVSVVVERTLRDVSRCQKILDYRAGLLDDQKRGPKSHVGEADPATCNDSRC